MVKIAVAGGSGNIGQGIVDALIASQNHEVVILSRKDAPTETVQGFLSAQGETAQTNLIDAAVEAGVNRFAPSEWAGSGIPESMPWYAYKGRTRQYLEELNKEKTVLEYTLFQPGFLMNYLTRPYKSSKHVHQLDIHWDLEKRRVLMMEEGDNDRITLTTVQDIANVVTRAIDYEGKWPTVGGMKGTDMTMRELLALAEEVRGAPFAVERLKAKELETGDWKSSWVPKMDHPSVPVEQQEIFARFGVAGVLRGFRENSFHSSDEWNRLLPAYHFTDAKQFLTEAWKNESIAKRRKLRKGTQSCWECKRRKVRCVFTLPSNIICDNCQRRNTTCIGQEHPDQPRVSSIHDPIEDRLGRVEDFIQQLAKNLGMVHDAHSRAAEVSKVALPSFQGQEAQIAPSIEPPEPAKPNSPFDTVTSSDSWLKPFSSISTSSEHYHIPASGKYVELVRELVTAWPSQADIDIICTLPVGLSAYLSSGIFPHHSEANKFFPSSAKDILNLPPPNSHPVLFARKLLILGAFLQGVPPNCTQKLGTLGAKYRNIMLNVVEKATRLVTTNEELVGSVEGIECILIEALYHNYAGNLNKAWMAIHRAINVAQMMALHRDYNLPSLESFGHETRISFDELCFYLARMDWYLSLMLDLPQSSLETQFTTPEALARCQPIDRVQRIHCIVARRILQRTEADLKDLANVSEIDKLLQRVAEEVPPQWWIVPNFVSHNGDITELISDMLRVMDQFAHHQLVIRLHLPYLLNPSSDSRYNQSKIVAVQASPIKLSRLIRHLLTIESNATKGIEYNTHLSKDEKDCLVQLKMRMRSRVPIALGPEDSHQLHSSEFSRSEVSDFPLMELSALGNNVAMEDDYGWDLQGVDLALFNGIFHGIEIPGAEDGENWGAWKN
ncbi:hypothetical protein N7495_000862 [Penicillium taxi]|uniref:uncharacterized protein n=1 Tax=Penicillium taxi TaxID=168475 RepID=UPI0025450203|nr:uncharacterized protein N7495_000862 [Penicillium taxi]KAJ5908180.1 hypothetical protein N7495_000862 [Penicillium taxi]